MLATLAQERGYEPAPQLLDTKGQQHVAGHAA